MNKHLYRLIFNRALGVIQVVAEIAKGSGGKGAIAGGTSAVALRPLSFALWTMLGFVSVIPAALSQVVADPTAPGNQKPTVLPTPDGVPVVNIQTPSAAGVSRNTYSQFDVDGKGVILNNSRTNVQTQLGGWISSNPWLATGTAKVILNEVNSSNPSYLNGYIEVGGTRAQVVIANPAGISVNGGGFLNASRVTLTTGTPILTGGALDGYRVDGGSIRIEDNGLDATQTDYTDLIARSLQLNGGIWANQLQATLGSNIVSADHTQVTAQAATSVAPVFALDSSALGGMYANKISLVGTEHGVGVRNAGTIGAQAGELTVTVDGRIENTGALQSATNTHVSASGGIANAGTLSATRELTLDTPLDLDNSGGTLNAQRIEVNAASLRNRGGSIEQTGAQVLALNANTLTNRDDGRIGLATPATDSGTGTGTGGTGGGAGTGTGTTDPGTGGGTTAPLPLPEVLPDGALNIAGTLDNDGGYINSGGGVSINTANGLDNSGGHLGVKDLTLTQGDLGNAGGELSIAGNAFLRVNQLTNDGGRLEVAGALDIAAQNLSNRSGVVSHSGTAPATVTIAGTLDNTAGTLATNASTLALQSSVLVNEDGRIEHAGTGGMTLTTDTLSGARGTLVTAGTLTLDAGQVDHQDATLSAAQYAITADSFDNRGGTITASGTDANTIDVTGTLDNSEGTIGSSGDLAITAATFGNAAGTVLRAGTGTLAIDAATLNGAGGTLASNGALTITGATTDLRGGTTQAQRIAIDTGTLTTAGGTLTAAGTDPLAITARILFDNAAGQIGSNGALQLNAGALTNTHGVISAAGTAPSQVTVSTTLENSRGTLATSGDLTVTTQDLVNQGGELQTAGALHLTSSGRIDNSAQGLIASGGDTTITTPLLDNTNGTIQHAGTGTLAIDATTLNGAGGSIASNGALTLTGETTDLRNGNTFAQSITVDTGTLTTAGGTLTASGTGPLAITARTSVDNTAGQIGTNGALQLNAGTLTNTNGAISAAGTAPSQVTVGTTLENTGGLLASTGDLTVDAQDVINAGGTVQTGGALTLSADGHLDNSAQSTIASGGDMALTTPLLDNTNGTIQSAGSTLAIDAATLNGNAGTIASNGALTIEGATTDLRNGVTSAQSITVNAGTLTTAGGSLSASGTGPLTLNASVALDNTAGQIATNGAAQITTGTLTNVDGRISAAGTDASNVQASGTLDNTRGMIATTGAATVHGGTVNNTAGTLYGAGDLTVTSDGDLINRDAGRIQSDANLTLTAAGALDNTGSVIDATGATSVTAAQITNTSGQIVAGTAGQPDAALTITTAGTLNNQGGTVGNRGGDVSVQAATVDNSASGTIVAQRDITLNTASVDNSSGTVYATQTLRYENAAGTLQNAGGQFGAGDNAWINLANVSNTNGGRIQAGTVWLTTPTLDIAGGEVAANQLHADLTTLNGVGRLYGAQWLDVAFSGDFTYANGQRFDSDGLLELDVAGTFTNQGTLQTAGELDVTAANLVNQGTINASNDAGTGVARLTVGGTLDNQTGASIEGDTVALSATNVTNTGDITGDVVGIEADTLTNGRDLGTGLATIDYGEGFIGASEYLELRIAQSLRNLDAEIFSAGDLNIGGRTDGTRTALVENNSGRIQADGNVSIAADTILNQRRLFVTQWRTLTATEQAQNTGVDAPVLRYRYDDTNPAHQEPSVTPSQILDAAEIADADATCEANWVEDARRCMGHRGGGGSAESFNAVTTNTATEVLEISASSADGQILSGGDMSLDTAALTNDKSKIAAGGNLFINSEAQDEVTSGTVGGGSVTNTAWTPLVRVNRTTDYGVQWERLQHNPRRWLDGDYWIYNTTTETVELAVTTDNRPAWMTLDPGAAVSSTITAGGALVITATGDVTNTSVSNGNGLSNFGANGGLNAPNSTTVGPVGGSGATGPQAPVGTTGGNNVGSTGGANGAAPQVVGTPERPLPGLVPADNGMFDINADPNSPFLVTTAPRFTGGDNTGSNYLLSLFGVDTYLHKRLGDGYYEQRLVMEQILQLTGRRSLHGGDGASEYRNLMDVAAQEATRLGLTLGVPLTSSQIGALNDDIVWLVEMEVNGQKVLAPVVYLSKATADRLAASGALMAGDTLDIQSSSTIHNNGTLTGDRGTWLSADTLINDGAILSRGRVAIATVGDTVNRGAIGGNTVTIDAGGSVVNTVRVDGIGTVNVGTITAGTGGLHITATQDVINQGQITSGGHGIVNAGRDFVQNAASVTSGPIGLRLPSGSFTTAGSAVITANRDVVLDQGSITAGEHAVIEAGRDVHFTAADVKAGGSIVVTAERDIISDTVTTAVSETTEATKGKTHTTTTVTDETVHGSTFQADGDVAMVAKNDITLTAATVSSKDGGIAISAGNKLTLNTADETHSVVTDSTKKKSGLLSSSTTKKHDAVTDTYAIGTTLSGERVDLSSGNDMRLEGAVVAGDQGVTLVSGGNLDLLAASNTHTESHSKDTKTSGVFGTGGIGFTIGQRKTGDSLDVTETTHTGTLIGSAEGRVDIVAKKDVTITGSDVLSNTGTLISGENVTIQHVEDTLDVTQKQYAKQGGINVSLKGGVADVAMAVYGAAKRADEVEDDRLKGLYAAKTAQTLFSDAAGGGVDGLTKLGQTGQQIDDLANTNMQTKAKGNAGLSLRIGIGGSSSESESNTHQTTAHGSTIRSNGDIAIVAREGDLTITGSRVEGENVGLAAKQNILLQSAEEAAAQKERSKASSGEIGVTIGSEAGIGVYVSATAAKGRGDGNGTAYTETVIQGNKSVSFVSGNNTTLEGAQIIGERVVGDVGGNLTIRSQQDTNEYQRKDQSAGVDVAVGFGGGSASINYAQSKIDSNYRSVIEQSGIQAGSGGFQINVNGHTQLDGGAIASTADPSKNYLSTGSLGYTDLKNEAAFKVSSISVSASGGNTGGGGSGSFMQQDDKATSTTKAGIADGTVIVKDGSGAGIERGTTELQKDGLKQIFDEQKLADQAEMMQVASEVGMTAAGDLADQMGWKEGSKEKAILHGLVGAGIAALGGADPMQGLAGAAASQLATVKMQQFLNDNGIDPDSPLGRSLMQLGSMAIGAAVGGSTGAATALAGEQFNRQLHPDEAEKLAALKEGKSAEEQKRLNDAMCALVHCSAGVPDSDPNKAALVASEQRGQGYTTEQQQIKQAGAFNGYTKTDSVNDWLLRHDEGITRFSGTVQAVGGAAGAVGATAGAAATSPACATVAGCLLPIGLGGAAVLSANELIDGSNKALGSYSSTQGQRVLDSFDPNTHWGPQNPAADLGLDGATAGLHMLLGKFGGRLLTVDPEVPKINTGGKPATGTGTPGHLLPDNIRGDGLNPVRNFPDGTSPNLAVDVGQQNKHVIGTNEFKTANQDKPRSPLAPGVDSQELVNRFAGTGQPANGVPLGQPGSKERINFGTVIGTYIDRSGSAVSTTNGIIHYSKKGVHIVPARPGP